MPFKEPISIIVRKHLWASLYVMLSFCAPLCVAADDRLVVFVSIPPQQYFVDVIGANHVISKNLIEPVKPPKPLNPHRNS
jgi:ABC-type Zn uptake system ZnuABC Zn-binding protein ZnuA